MAKANEYTPLYCMACREQIPETRVHISASTCSKACANTVDNVRRRIRYKRGRPVPPELMEEFQSWRREMRRAVRAKAKESTDVPQEGA